MDHNMSDKVSAELAREALWRKFVGKFFSLKSKHDSADSSPEFLVMFQQLMLETGSMLFPTYAETKAQINKVLSITDIKYADFINAMFFVHFKIHMNSITEESDAELLTRFFRLSDRPAGPTFNDDCKYIFNLVDLMVCKKSATA